MGKQAAERRLDDTEAQAFLRAVRTSARKLNLVAQTIRGKDAAKALAELTFSRRRIAHCLLFLPVSSSEEAMRPDRDCAKIGRPGLKRDIIDLVQR